MADELPPRAGAEPTMWFVVFKRTSPLWWVRRLAFGRFKHVAAFGWLPDQQLWVFYEVGVDRSRIAVLPAGPDAEAEIAVLERDAVVVAFAPRARHVRCLRPGFWCSIAVAHLIGLPTTPLTPSGLFRACLKHGGSIATGDPDAAISPAALHRPS